MNAGSLRIRGVERLKARADPSTAEALNCGDLYVADGVGVVWAAGYLGRRGVQRYPGIELAQDLLERLASRGGSVYLLGAGPGVAKRAARRLTSVMPGLSIAGTHNGFFRQRQDRTETEIVAAITASEPDLLLVGMGCPMQEGFITMHRKELGVPLMIGVGGALEVFAGVRSRAPLWLRRLGLEWLSRSLAHPSRLKRFLHIPVFVSLVLRQARSRSRGQRGGRGKA
ncbi:WecB/TagA/CpsF family glycosyltransferase [bacterium]|nr:WecB/TagA/CpsF family glycosyltransferase [bacterium]